MNIEEYREHLNKAKQQIIEELPKISAQIAVSTLSLIKNRSIEEGIIIDGKEGSHKQYSTNEVYTSSFKKKTLNSGGAAYIAANKKGNWYGLRQAQGLRSQNVNLSYTNRMWTNIQVVRGESNGYGKFQSVVSGIDQETKDKISGNVDRYGMFLDPTPEEIELGQEVARARLLEIVKGS